MTLSSSRLHSPGRSLAGVSRRSPGESRAVDTLAQAASFYDSLDVREWLRLDADARARVVFHMHRSILTQHVNPGDRVLDAGAGPGRFAIELTRIGASVVAGDISAVQSALSLQALHARSPSGAQAHVLQMTVTMLPFSNETFDAAVCFGSVLSHCGQQAEEAARELVRVTKSGGRILLSMQPTQNHYLPDLLEQARVHGLEAVDEAILNGTELGDDAGLAWRSFSYAEIEVLAQELGCEVVEISASNVLATVENIPLLEQIELDERLWGAFLRWEEHLGRQRGNAERGSHIIATLRKSGTSRERRKEYRG